MGLDMYLKAERYVGGWEHNGDEAVERFNRVVDDAGLSGLATRESPSATVTINVAYWRKDNQIHAWFVDNVQDGVDECKRTYVERDQLAELLELCKRARADRDPELLPPRDGFFFGGTAIDEWYWKGIDVTVVQLEHVLAKLPADATLYYESSW